MALDLDVTNLCKLNDSACEQLAGTSHFQLGGLINSNSIAIRAMVAECQRLRDEIEFLKTPKGKRAAPRASDSAKRVR